MIRVVRRTRGVRARELRVVGGIVVVGFSSCRGFVLALRSQWTICWVKLEDELWRLF